ncbi:TetR/AcrR family transcriptional regulator [Glycomyces sp. NPDC048151]|uniref:TetR/AcrR family transcriptional regulator n=1 Tax=Glycomyces sp. NPDC048151 TaxID=3364002 RepID=UPI003714BDD3
MTPAEPQNARGRRTRAALLEAIFAIVESQGFEGLTMNAVADRAGVSRRAIYLHFRSRADLIPALHDYAVEHLGLVDSLERIWEQETPEAVLDEWARHLTRVNLRAKGVHRAIRNTRHSDPAVADYQRGVAERQRQNCRVVVERLERAGRLDPQWGTEEAVDMFWALIATDMMESLADDCGWDADRVAARLGFLLRRTFLAP